MNALKFQQVFLDFFAHDFSVDLAGFLELRDQGIDPSDIELGLFFDILRIQL